MELPGKRKRGMHIMRLIYAVREDMAFDSGGRDGGRSMQMIIPNRGMEMKNPQLAILSERSRKKKK